MPARDTSAHPIMIAPESSIMEAARLMSELDVGALPVGDGHTVLGMVTDRDITLRAAARGSAPRSIAVAEVMRWHTNGDLVDALPDADADKSLLDVGPVPNSIETPPRR